ncbi:MAG TPA: oligoendopeptidase F [Chlamydiales bacterium]|nr:oligoendopeptidase F [Chlamydiales bacterium]
MILDRTEVPKEHQWNVEAMYPNFHDWLKQFELCGKKSAPRWPELEQYKGSLHSSPEKLSDALKLYFDIDRVLAKLYTYSHLRYDEDLGNEEMKKANTSISNVLHDFQMETSWIEPELLKISDNDFKKLIAAPQVKKYAFFLEKIRRMRNHTLTEEEEKLLSLSGKALEVSHRAFSSFNNADLKFPNILDSKGQSHPLSHGLYLSHLKNPDRTLRQNAYITLHNGYLQHENTLAELLQGQVQNHFYIATARNYKSCVEAALFPHNIDLSVYHNLIAAVKKHIQPLHKYLKLRKKALGVEELRVYDLYIPIVSDIDWEMDYKEASQTILEAFAPLGAEYQTILQKGLNEDRWVDIFENKRKRSGAYSSGCYDSMPYILMNYHNTLNDVFTLAHEAGHSMHSYLSRTHQNYIYSQYPIFVAEVASTLNEQLLLHLLLKKAKTSKEKAYLINYAIDAIRGTLFRQTLFAEFELKIHDFIEKGIPLTPQLLKKEYLQLNQEYYGPDVVLDDQLSMEWARIPHFYYNFYVYQYATGISAALALVQGVLKDGGKKEKYLEFLSSGGSKYPIDLLQTAGVNMRSEDPVRSALEHFAYLVDELEKLIK